MLTSWILVKLFYFLCGIGGIIANSFLLIIVVFCSSRSIGSYRFLIACFLASSLFTSVSNTILMPMMSVNSNGWMLFAVGVHEEQKAGSYFLILFCTSVIILLLSLTYSFLDRVTMVYSCSLFGNNKKCVFMIMLFLTITSLWSSQTGLFLMPTEKLSEIHGDHLRRFYGLNIDSVAYMAAQSYENGTLSFNFGFVFITRLIVIKMCFIAMIFCAFLIHHRLMSDLSQIQLSERTMEVQKKLFRVLLVQTSVPLLFTYTPLLISLILAFARFDIPELCEIISLLLPLAQFLDPIVIFIFVSDYRRVARALCKMLTNISRISSEQSITT